MQIKDKIQCEDDFLNPIEFAKVHSYCKNAPYYYGEIDDYGRPPTGMVNTIHETNEIYTIFKQRVEEKINALKELNLYRMYVNIFAPGEIPYFHQDGLGLTCLYYANWEWDLQDGGETQLYLDGNIMGLPPIPNRLVVFDGMIQHRATALRSKHRFTVAIKYGYEEAATE